ncbi:MAG: CpXC domain-containing protein, partial [Anaerolineae bacterium]|nr:CpXC domain-containing protein [Anaerolineae bacterium]
MSHSLAQSTQLICPHCNRPFDAEIWLIVDAAERPDLFEKVKQDKLHDLTCPHCGFVEQADAPLLLYLDSPLPGGEGAEVRVLFSPAQRTSAEQDEEAARKLVARLRKSLGATWQDEWLVQMPVILRPGLSLALTEGLEAAQQKVREQTDVRVPPELREVLAELARRGATIRSVEDLQRALEQHPDLREKLERLSTQAQPDPTLSRRFQELVGLHTQAEHAPALWPQVLRGWQELIAQAEEREESQLAAYARANLANTYSRLYEVTGDSSWAEQAEALFEELSRVFTRQQAPQTWGITQHALGNLFARRYERSG